MTVVDQVRKLVELGVHELAGVPADQFHDLADGLSGEGIVSIHPSLVPVSILAARLRLGAKEGFIVDDMVDVDEFVPLPSVAVPDRPLYLVVGVDRGDDLRGWTPDNALPEILDRGRSPLTINEGISWLLQQPERLEANHCFMCIGSRKAKGAGLDTRTPAIWISRGTGRDGAERRNAPKVGWCWSGNHHTWLGCASALARSG